MGAQVICPSGQWGNDFRRPDGSNVSPPFDRRDGRQSSKATIESRQTASRTAIYIA
jgi:hypothetical protein